MNEDKYIVPVGILRFLNGRVLVTTVIASLIHWVRVVFVGRPLVCGMVSFDDFMNGDVFYSIVVVYPTSINLSHSIHSHNKHSQNDYVID